MSKYFEKPEADAFKRDVRKWAREQLKTMQSNVKTMTNNDKHAYLRNLKKIRTGQTAKSRIRHESLKLMPSINQKIGLYFGVPERVIFPFAKHGFFIAHGFSRGHGKNQTRRKKADWYSFVFENQMEILADIALKYQADSTVKAAANLNLEK